MQLSASHKALIITLLFSISVLLMAYNLHVKKQNETLAETFYEMVPEDFFEELEDEETLEDILKSFDNLSSTNQAYNEQQASNDFEDEEFKEAMEKLQSRNATHESYEAKQDFETSDNREASEALSEINDLIKKTSGNEGNNANSTISFSLLNRTKKYIPPPIYLCANGGKIVVSIVVNGNGQVIETTYNNASNSNDECLIDHALEYAKAALFSSDGSKKRQIGTITFNFQGKR